MIDSAPSSVSASKTYTSLEMSALAAKEAKRMQRNLKARERRAKEKELRAVKNKLAKEKKKPSKSGTTAKRGRRKHPRKI